MDHYFAPDIEAHLKEIANAILNAGGKSGEAALAVDTAIEANSRVSGRWWTEIFATKSGGKVTGCRLQLWDGKRQVRWSLDFPKDQM
jgi:hypothetical protein